MPRNKRVFLIVPNNFGGTMLYKTLDRMRNVVCLHGRWRGGSKTDVIEGEKLVWTHYASQQENLPLPVPIVREPMHNPDGSDLLAGWGRLWASDLPYFDRDELYDWSRVLEIWDDNWKSFKRYKEDALLVEKSPTSPAWAQRLASVTSDEDIFIIGMRDPYASVEGLRRRARKHTDSGLEIERIAKIWLNIARRQMENAHAINNACVVTYEELCDKDGQKAVRERLANHDKRLAGIDFRLFKSMNANQVARLKEEEIDEITRVITQDMEVLTFFGYDRVLR